MTRPPIFNDYDDRGYRRNTNGNRSSRVQDEAIVRNLRHRWPAELADLSDPELVNAYDEFAVHGDFGNNDEKFLAWIDKEEIL